MIIRSHTKRSIFSRLFGSRRNLFVHGLSESDFALYVEKEKLRASRRGDNNQFCVIVLFVEDLPKHAKRVCRALRNQLRMTDEIGCFRGNVGILLPETNEIGGECVAEKLGALFFSMNIKMELEVLVYPKHDIIASKAGVAYPATADSSDEKRDDDGETGSESVSEKQQESQPEPIESASSVFFKSTPTPIWKRLLDIVGASIALVLFSPFLILAAIAIKLDSKGPVFFRQKREGKDGRIFDILKFRTMRSDAESLQAQLRQQEFNEQDGPAFKLTDDPRITWVGKYLRKTCLDEVPQMINVLLGQMSLVGPRPLPVGESYQSEGWQRERLKVLPGLTCIWQVQGRRDIEFDEWMRLDMKYIQERSLWLDLKILFQTAMVVVLHRGSV